MSITLPPLPMLDLSRDNLYGYTADQMRAHAAAVSAAKDAEISRLRERVRVLEDQLRTALTIIGHPDDDIIKAMRDALEQKP